MSTKLPILLLLTTAVICLLLGPVILLFFPMGGTALTVGTLMILYGAIALWIGMKQLDTTESTSAEPPKEG